MIEQTQTAYPPCTGTIHQKHIVIAFAWTFSKTLGTPFKKPNANKTSKINFYCTGKLFHAAASIITIARTTSSRI